MAAQKHKGATPATALLRQRGVEFAVHEFTHMTGDRNYGTVAAESLGIDARRVFKTLLAKVDGSPPP
ncbi:MAG: Cys-tRNA(Pro) deacylase, partial [Acidimicrobiales bacterium]